MSFFWLVVVFGWVIPIVIRRMSQDPRRRQIPPRDRGYNRYGGYPGNPYPRGFPGMQPPPQQGPNQQGSPQQPEGPPVGPPPGESVPPPLGEGAWWQQPIPPGSFPGQTIPEPSPAEGQPAPGQSVPVPPRLPDQTMSGQTMPGQAFPEPPPMPESSEPQGYRARKLAELDRKFTDQKISLEEYMKARNEVMRG
ncbi:hypothetical protein [Sinomonas humi]|uniref:SHOCT domain-containing protein n=1 Tax=Sinomonas humi TaxID=1338436 RepID=A0A0B2AHC9_9MICC|nr:hypothetical protein [Sinomonas humi]KHL01168.1 hypothetical protein LK10_17175 [Sinomonas humi]